MIARMRRIWIMVTLVALLSGFPCVAVAQTVLTPVKVTAKATVYAKANRESKVLGTLKKGQLLALVATNGDWAKVELNGKTGFMNKKLLKQTSVSMYVKANAINVYASNSTSSKKLGVLGYGQKLSVLATSGSWAKVKLGGNVGFCKKASLTTNDVNDDSYTVYAQTDGVKVYAAAATGANVLTKVNTNAKIRVVAITSDGKWCRCKNGSQYGYIQKSKLGVAKVVKEKPSESTGTPAGGAVLDADWFESNIQSVFCKGKKAVVTDVKTGLSFNIVRKGGSNHADCEPRTAEDTAVMKKICGTWSWARRAIWVSVGGTRYAASMNTYPHGEYTVDDNGYDGHFCIHFTNSKTHETNQVDDDHQDAVKKALKAN